MHNGKNKIEAIDKTGVVLFSKPDFFAKIKVEITAGRQNWRRLAKVINRRIS